MKLRKHVAQLNTILQKLEHLQQSMLNSSDRDSIVIEYIEKAKTELLKG